MEALFDFDAQTIDKKHGGPEIKIPMIGKEKERGDLFMNKNLRRALNTTAAVSMSLAMVLGAVAPVTNVSAASIEKIVDNKKIL